MIGTAASESIGNINSLNQIVNLLSLIRKKYNAIVILIEPFQDFYNQISIKT